MRQDATIIYDRAGARSRPRYWPNRPSNMQSRAASGDPSHMGRLPDDGGSRTDRRGLLPDRAARRELGEEAERLAELHA